MRPWRLAAIAAIAVLGPAPVAGRPAWADRAAAKNNEGNRLYEQRRYEEALKMYTDAQATRPEAPELHYNIGNVLFRKGELDKALEEYRRAQSAAGSAVAPQAVYNGGNALLHAGKLQEAVNAYVQALRARPDDRDAKRNLEIALRMLQEKQKQDSSSKQESPKDQDRNPPQPAPTPKPQDGSSGPKPAARPRPDEMTGEEARRILDSLRDAEREEIKKHLQAGAPSRREPEQDW